MKNIYLPEASEPDTMYVISKLYISAGDHVSNGDAIVCYEEEKSVVDINADCDGVIKEIFVNEGDVVSAGSKICAIE